LRRAAAYAGYNGTQIADGWLVQGRVSRLLAGKRGGSGCDVSASWRWPDYRCGTGASFGLVVNTQHDWFVQHGPSWFRNRCRRLLILSTGCEHLGIPGPWQVPERLQTPGYPARAVPGRRTCLDKDIDERWHTGDWSGTSAQPAAATLCVFFLHDMCYTCLSEERRSWPSNYTTYYISLNART